jgi:hypothetical protein
MAKRSVDDEALRAGRSRDGSSVHAPRGSLWPVRSVDQRLGRFEERFERRLLETTGALRDDIAATRADLLRWPFLFWVGQPAAMPGWLALAFRSVPR